MIYLLSAIILVAYLASVVLLWRSILNPARILPQSETPAADSQIHNLSDPKTQKAIITAATATAISLLIVGPIYKNLLKDIEEQFNVHQTD